MSNVQTLIPLGLASTSGDREGENVINFLSQKGSKDYGM